MYHNILSKMYQNQNPAESRQISRGSVSGFYDALTMIIKRQLWHVYKTLYSKIPVIKGVLVLREM